MKYVTDRLNMSARPEHILAESPVVAAWILTSRKTPRRHTHLHYNQRAFSMHKAGASKKWAVGINSRPNMGRAFGLKRICNLGFEQKGNRFWLLICHKRQSFGLKSRNWDYFWLDLTVTFVLHIRLTTWPVRNNAQSAYFRIWVDYRWNQSWCITIQNLRGHRNVALQAVRV